MGPSRSPLDPVGWAADEALCLGSAAVALGPAGWALGEAGLTVHAAVALGPRGAGPTLPSSWSRSVSRPPSGAP